MRGAELSIEPSVLRAPAATMLSVAAILPFLPAAARLPFLPAAARLPCPLRMTTGIPCPFCGMTTSVVATVSGDVLSAIAINPFGPLLVGLAIFLVVRRRRLIAEPWRVPLAIVVPLVAASWVFQLFRVL